MSKRAWARVGVALLLLSGAAQVALLWWAFA
jgi:hypothetical protein